MMFEVVQRKWKLVGVLVLGGGVNLRHWKAEREGAGYFVRLCDGWAEYYRQ